LYKLTTLIFISKQMCGWFVSSYYESSSWLYDIECWEVQNEPESKLSVTKMRILRCKSCHTRK